MTITTMLHTAHESKDGTFPIVIRVEHAGKKRRIPIGFKIPKKYWGGHQAMAKCPDAGLINAVIAQKESEIRHYLADCQLHGKPIHLDLIGTGRASYSFSDYLWQRAEQCRQAGKIVMGRKLSRFVVELGAVAGRNTYFEDITPDFIRKYEQYLVDNGNVQNTRYRKIKFLGEYYGHAMQEGKAVGPNPFRSHKITKKPVKKEKLTEAELKALEDLELSPGPVADARNLFLFSYYAKGARFENCIMLRRGDIIAGRIHFRTNKGNKHISVKLHARLQAILDQYPSGEYIFPYVKEQPTDPTEYLKQVDSKNVIVNRNLKVAARLAEISKPVTFHMARHSFAYHLKGVTDSIHVIKDSLGHSDTRTTEIYLRALDDERLDSEMDKLYGA